MFVFPYPKSCVEALTPSEAPGDGTFRDNLGQSRSCRWALMEELLLLYVETPESPLLSHPPPLPFFPFPPSLLPGLITSKRSLEHIRSWVAAFSLREEASE